MKFNTYNFNEGVSKVVQANVPLNSDYAIGVKFYDDGGNALALQPSNVKLVDESGTETTASKAKNGYQVFILNSSDGENDRRYSIVVNAPPVTTTPDTYTVRTKKVIGTKEQWIKNSSLTHNITAPELTGKEFTFEEFGNIKCLLNWSGEGYNEDKEPLTIKEVTEGKAANSRYMMFTVGATTYWYWISSTTTTAYADIEQGLYKLNSGSTILDADKIDKIVIDDSISIPYIHFDGASYNPTSEDVPLNTPISFTIKFQIPAKQFTTPEAIVINEEEELESELANAIYDNTIHMSGTFTDGSEFDYEIPIK